MIHDPIFDEAMQMYRAWHKRLAGCLPHSQEQDEARKYLDEAAAKIGHHVAKKILDAEKKCG